MDNIISLFHKQVLKNGEKVAVCFEDKSYSYNQLERESNKLAQYLQARGIGKSMLVGICLERSIEMIVGLLGILKTGAAYVPLDWTHPIQRNQYIISQSKLKMILTQESLKARIPNNVTHICIEELKNISTQETLYEHTSCIDEEQPAYVIYTSGSTGKPKGVIVEHKGLTNFLKSMVEILDLSGQERSIAVITITFDISVSELFLPLVSGGTVVIANQETVKDGVKLCNLMEQEEITLIQATPSTIYMLLDAGWKGNNELIIGIGGEAWGMELAQQLLEDKCKALWNLYGPTETTVFSTAAKVKLGDKAVFLGQPLLHTHLYVLNEKMESVEEGEEGELYIGGLGVAKGYLYRQELTDAHFLKKSRGQGEERIYKTGDLVKRVDEEHLIYIGRRDFQVKIRGYRIELGEIEKAILSIPEVLQAVVVPINRQGENYLKAYIKASKKIDSLESRYLLEQLLPDYMIPQFFIQLEEYPMTSSGKIDRKSLIEREVEDIDGETYVGPRTEIEAAIITLWEELLGIEPIGIKDGFLELGGHSLMANRLVIRMNKLFGTNLSLLDILSTELTVEDMAKAVEENLIGNLSEEEIALLLEEVGEE